MGVEIRDEPIERTEHPYAMLPRPLQWLMSFPHSPLWLGAAAGLAYLAVDAVAVAAGLFEPLGWEGGSFWVDAGMLELSYALYFAWVPVAAVYLVRGSERDARNLAPVLGAEGPAWEALRGEALTVGRGPVWAGAAVGLGFTAMVAWVAFSGVMVIPGSYTLGMAVWTLGREITVELAVFCTLGWGVAASLVLGRLTRERARLDLLDLGALSPLSRNGTRLALFTLLVVAIGLPALLEPPERMGAAVFELFLIVTVGLGLLALALLLVPIRGARSAIRAAKAMELASVRRQIDEARQSRQDERLPGLLEWERRIVSVSEWPIDTRSLGRIGFYLLIPLTSWVGGALVERIVDALLG